MQLIWLLLKSSWWSVVVAIATGLISGTCSAQLIVLVNAAINDNSPKRLLSYFALLAVIGLGTGMVSQFLLVDLIQEVIYKLRLRLSHNILAAPLRRLEELGANRLLATLTEDVLAISGSVFAIPFMCIDLAIIMGCLAYLGWLSGPAFAVTVGAFVVAIVIIQLLINQTLRLLELARSENDQLYKHFQTITNGVKELKIHNQRRRDFLETELQATAATTRNLTSQAMKTSAIALGGGQFIFFIILGLVVFGLPRFLPVNPQLLSAYVVTITFLSTPVQSLMERLPALLTASVSLQKVEKMGLALTESAEITAITHPPLATTWLALELRQIKHTYRSQSDHEFGLGEINLEFYPGQLVFIIGGNGSGKSTLVKILTGLYPPESGEICLDGIVIADHNREWYRQHFAVVFSDFYLFDRFLGLEHNDLKAKNYLKQLELDHKVQIKDGQLSTLELSQGQRKRLALLTAYLEDRPIYVFDEWAADQDPVFKAVFYEQLLPELRSRGKTVIVISHDDHYFHVADRVIKLDYGQVEYDNLL